MLYTQRNSYVEQHNLIYLAKHVSKGISEQTNDKRQSMIVLDANGCVLCEYINNPDHRSHPSVTPERFISVFHPSVEAGFGCLQAQYPRLLLSVLADHWQCDQTGDSGSERRGAGLSRPLTPADSCTHTERGPFDLERFHSSTPQRPTYEASTTMAMALLRQHAD